MEPENKNSKIAWWLPGIKVFIKISGWIVLPALIAVLLGNKLDSQFNTKSFFVFLCIALSFIISMIMVIRISINYGKTDTKRNDD